MFNGWFLLYINLAMPLRGATCCLATEMKRMKNPQTGLKFKTEVSQ